MRKKNIADSAISDVVNSLDKPLYNPFVERYVLDELKLLRIDLAAQKSELNNLEGFQRL